MAFFFLSGARTGRIPHVDRTYADAFGQLFPVQPILDEHAYGAHSAHNAVAPHTCRSCLQFYGIETSIQLRQKYLLVTTKR